MDFSRRFRRALRPVAALCAVACCWGADAAFAQQFTSPTNRHFPLNQQMPPGTAAQWGLATGKINPNYMQFLRVELPTTGKVTFYSPQYPQPVTLDEPAMARFQVGHVYRLRISDMPEFPNAALYPTVELLDHLHPPAEKATQFPIPVQFTAEEIDAALSNRMVTKVIYLEQPQLARPFALGPEETVESLEQHQNLLAEADQRGRPMAIIRLGSRQPNPRYPEPGFWGTGGPVWVPRPAPEKQPAQ